jgi:CheY-like chemotaxis protein
MPEMDGWAFADAYGQTPPPHAPILFLTAATIWADGTVAGRALPVGARLLPKPFALDDLLAVVQAAGAPG